MWLTCLVETLRYKCSKCYGVKRENEMGIALAIGILFLVGFVARLLCERNER